jgi:signal transduction histidine kinase
VSAATPVPHGGEREGGPTVTITEYNDDACLAGAAEFPSLRMLCHDLIEPAAAVRLLASAAATDLGPDAAGQDRLRLIAEQAAQIALICEHVLEPPERVSPARIDRFAEFAVAGARSWYSGIIEAVTEPVTVQESPAVAIRILNNLLINACRAAGPGGRVRVTVDQVDGHARVAVADSGSGLGSGTPGRSHLGLEIVASMTLGSGGSVRMGVSDLGGVAVTVWLPCTSASPSPASPEAELLVEFAGRDREGYSR